MDTQELLQHGYQDHQESSPALDSGELSQDTAAAARLPREPEIDAAAQPPQTPQSTKPVPGSGLENKRKGAKISAESVWGRYRRPLIRANDFYGHNVLGYIVLAAVIAGIVDLVQRKLEQHGNALYLPNFSLTREEQARITGHAGYGVDPSGYFPPLKAPEPTAAVEPVAVEQSALLEVPSNDIETLNGFVPRSALPPAPGAASAPPAQPAPAQPVGGGGAAVPPPMQTYTISQGLLQKIIQRGGVGADGCLARPLQSNQAFPYPPPPGTTTAIAQVKGTERTVVFRFEADQLKCIQEAQG